MGTVDAAGEKLLDCDGDHFYPQKQGLLMSQIKIGNPQAFLNVYNELGSLIGFPAPLRLRLLI